MLIDDFGDNGQAQPNALGLGREERIEDAFEMLGLNSFTVVADENRKIPSVRNSSDLDLLTRRACLNGVLNEIR